MTHETERDIMVRLLQLMGSPTETRALIREVTALMQSWSGCDAVGVRLHDGDDYPYCETRGFDPEFVAAENRLCRVDAAGNVARDADGNPLIDCMCGNVIAGRCDASLPFFTPYGSFWSNGTTALLATTTEADRQARTRNRCNGEGYESVALIPLKYGAATFGLLQFNDRRPDRFTLASINLLERLAAGVAIGLAQRREAEAARVSQNTLRALVNATDESVVMVDRHGVVLIANDIAASRLSRDRDELIGRRIQDLVPPGVATLRLKHLDLVLTTGKPARFVDQRDGCWFEHTINPVFDDAGEVTHCAIFARDITARVNTDEELRNAEKRYRTIIDKSPLAILLMRDRRFIYANPAGAAQLGYQPEEFAGVPIEAAIAPQDLSFIEQRIAKAALGRVNLPAEVRMIRRDGSHLAVESTSVPIVLSDGPAILVLAQDISARVRAEDAVRLQTMVLDQIFDKVTVTDLEGRITYVNDAGCQLLGRTAEELIGSSVESYGEDTSRGATQREIVERTLADGRWRGDVVNYAADGSSVVLDCRTHLVRDRAGDPVAMSGISTDVTEIRRAEQDLRDSEQRFRLLYEHLPVGYQSLDDAGRLLEVNPAWLSALGYLRSEVIGRYFGDFLAPSEVASFSQQFSQFLAGSIEQVELEMLHKDGSQVTMAFVARVGRDAGGRFLRTHCICTDVTRQRLLEQQYRQAQKMEAVGRLAAGVAHDFNNQLTVIRGYCDMLLSNCQPGDPLWRPLAEIMDASARAQATTSHLLSFSRKQILDPQLVDLGELLRGFCNPVSTMIGEDIKLVIAAPSDIHPILVDRSAMQQALMNLVVNARDAMPAGGELVLRATNLDLAGDGLEEYPDLQPGPHVVLEVRDSGAGMDAYTLERLFEPFFTTKPTGKGTGLGLPMVQGFVHQSHGAITVHSEPSAGTTIRIVLPAAPELAAVEGPIPEAGRPLAQRGSETILVVEDDENVRRMVVRCLAQSGYRVLEASGPRTALMVARDLGLALDLLVTDMVMPDMGGAELAAAVREVCADVAVLFISGYHEQGADSDPTDLLMKPFGPGELASRVRKALEGCAAKSSCPPPRG